ncbi:MAG: hypothetical protein LBQ88_08920 [Treponema sp.]|nr:hypothetical protein [Treponema sp.]
MEKMALGVHEFIEQLITEGVYGDVTFKFEAGEIKTIHQNLVWKMKDLYEAADQGLKKPPIKTDRPPLKRKRLIIRPGAVPSGSNLS